jgi:thiamine-monophosphate kinase
VHGEVDPEHVLRRDQANVGDSVFVTGYLGDGGAALALIQEQLSVPLAAQTYLIKRFYQPTPQIVAGSQLARVANAAIDISDGLLADAMHIANASGVGLQLQLEQLPIHTLLADIEQEKMLAWALSGGDDYQLLFTVSDNQREALYASIDQGRLTATPIGTVIAGEPTVQCTWHGQPYSLSHLRRGYQHFAS